MKRQIQTGDILFCKMNIQLFGAEEKIFVRGRLYRAVDNNVLLDEQGFKRYGWNDDIINTHFQFFRKKAS